MRKLVFEHNQDDFWQTLQSRVHSYFREKGISQHANRKMQIKMVIMLLALVFPYLTLIIFDLNFIIVLLLAFMLGLAMAGIGLTISHQAAHEAISGSKRVNRLWSLTFNILGMSDYIWKIKHNVYHHTYTNVFELDEALREGDVIRMSFDAPRKKIHRFQQYYTGIIYGLFTVFWAWFLDFEKLYRYHGHGSMDPARKHPKGEVILFYLTKVYYFCIVFVIPYYFTSLTIWQIIVVYLVVNITASTIITHVLQVEHLTDDTKAEKADDEGKIHSSWALTQLEGTSNFKANSRLFEWYLGGSNYQIEHHLFPKICAIHYPEISGIVRQTAREYDLRYNLNPSFGTAIRSHYQFLKKLGETDERH